jgi:4-amino-4-deoxy-L-arabinose transferase-like glycosyltransferase
VQEPLVPPGNPLRPRALAYLLGGSTVLVVSMASDAHSAWSVPLGFLAALVAAFGALDFAGCFDDQPEPALGRLPMATLRPRLLEVLGVLLAWICALRLAVAGVLPGQVWLAPLLVSVTSLAGVVATARLLIQLVPTGPKLARRWGFWLVLLGVGLYVPLLGSYSLLDPWEPHYAEVAREMLSRDDWLSLWWAQDGWFWSKPVLTFWLQGLSFALLGVRFGPDQMLEAAAHGRLPQPEWAARLPVVLLTLVAAYALYRFVAKASTARAGFLSGLVLLTMPYWSLLSHQSMTDMPYVAPVTAALSLFGLALLSDPEELAPSLELSAWGRRLRVSAFHALFALVLLSALPQLCYLLSRNVTLQLVEPPYGFRWHLDELFSGSGLHNCGLPGNEGCRGVQPANALFQPALGALLFGAALGYLLYLNRGERRLKRLLYLAAWYCTALAALAKGAPGLVLPVVVAGAVLATRRRWLELTRAELAGFGLVFAAVALPWYVQSYMRHGEPFTDRLLFHDMYKRAFVHVHDTNSGTDTSFRYYVWQLGYGMFPWCGLALVGLGQLLQRSDGTEQRLRELSTLMVSWLALGFGLFTLSLTKFHHYALPCAPPLAVGVGLLLDRAWRGHGQRDQALAVLAIPAALLTLLVARDLWTTYDGDIPASARLLHLVTYNYKRSWPEELNFETVSLVFGVVASALVAALALRWVRAHATALLCALGLGYGAFTLWIYLPRVAPHFGQRELFLAYYGARHGADEPIVAYQMNWKGENFYSGNRLPAFVSSGSKFKNWLKAQRERGTRVVFFVTEHGRISTLKSELGRNVQVTPLTDRKLNDKFALVRVELGQGPVEPDS